MALAVITVLWYKTFEVAPFIDSPAVTRWGFVFLTTKLGVPDSAVEPAIRLLQ
jgi:hypothetical protein